MKAHEVRNSPDEDARSEGLRSPVGSPIHEVELPVFGEDRGEVGTLVVLALEARKSQTSEGIIGCFAVVIEELWSLLKRFAVGSEEVEVLLSDCFHSLDYASTSSLIQS